MPIFAGGPWFLPLAIVLGLALIWKGGVRGRICVLMLAIALPLGDGWITNTIKHAVGRQRPCRVLENVNLPMRDFKAAEDESDFRRTGCSDSGSMPSAHASNWFAAAMVAWLFYRRTWRFMVPLACLVAFSRVYNGVHYPSDVLAGAVLGAGYGCAFLFAIDACWRFAAQRWFPLWFNAFPSLATLAKNPRDPSDIENPTASMAAHWLRLGYVVIALLFIFRLIYLASGRIELSEDEAYQWLWSKHLALSYFSKPPLIAYVQWLGTHCFGDREFGVRFFSPVCAAIGSLIALQFFANHASARAGFWLVVLVNLTPMLAAGSTLMTVDPLLALFWSLAMFAGWRAVQPNARTSQWIRVGLWMGLAFLSKYTALFQWVCWIVFFALWKPARIHLRRPGPWLALLINALCATPVIVWNLQHHWVTAGHVANDAKAGEGWDFGWRAPVEFIGEAAGVLHPMLFVAALWAAIAMWKRTRSDAPLSESSSKHDALLRFFFSMGAPLLLIYLLYTLHSSVLVNWIAAAVIPFFCLMALYWERRYLEGARHIRALLTIAVMIGTLAVVVLHETDLTKKIFGIYLPPRMDPLRRVRGWTQMARIVTRERDKLAEEGKPVFVIGGHYGTTSLLSFYMPEAKAALKDEPLVYFRYMAKPNTQFYFWPSYIGTRRGENAIYVQEKDKPAPAPADVLKEFASVTEIDRFPLQHRGRVLHYIQVFACRDLQR